MDCPARQEQGNMPTKSEPASGIVKHQGGGEGILDKTEPKPRNVRMADRGQTERLRSHKH